MCRRGEGKGIDRTCINHHDIREKGMSSGLPKEYLQLMYNSFIVMTNETGDIYIVMTADIVYITGGNFPTLEFKGKNKTIEGVNNLKL